MCENCIFGESLIKMKHLLFFVLVSTMFIRVFCQEPTAKNLGSFVGMPIGIKADELVDPNWKTQTMQLGASWEVNNGIKGSPFYGEDWNKGYVLLGDNHIAKNIPLRFNIYTNEIYFLLDSTVLVVSPNIPVAEFGINDKSDSNKITIFRCGYPAINNNIQKTFYNVVVNNKITLLRHYDKRIMEAANSTGAFERKFIDSESWYIYDSSKNKMVQIKKNKNSLLAALPEYSDKIQTIVQEKNLKLKNEKDWSRLLNELSDQ